MKSQYFSSKAKIFISYRRADSEGHTGRIYDRLEAHFGPAAIFLDVDTIPYGVDFVKYLDSAVTNSAILLAVIGERWIDSRREDEPHKGKRCLEDPNDFVRIEIRTALTHGIPVVPVLVGRGTMPSATSLPEDLKLLVRQNAAEVRPGRDFHVQVNRLISRLEELLSEIEKRGLTNFKLTDITFDDIAGYDTIKQGLRQLVPPQDVPDRLYHSIFPRGLLFHGPPGTGKTLFAKAVANKMNAKVHIVSAPDEIGDMYIGESERKLRELFAEARLNKPSILVVDEFDAIASKRSTRHEREEQEGNFWVNMICNEMDEFGPNMPVLLVGLTNRLDIIDPTLLRPSRFKPITIGYPDLASRRAILEMFARRYEIENLSEEQLSFIAHSTENLCGNDIHSFFKKAYITNLNSKVAQQEDLHKLAELIRLVRVAREKRDELFDFKGKRSDPSDLQITPQPGMNPRERLSTTQLLPLPVLPDRTSFPIQISTAYEKAISEFQQKYEDSEIEVTIELDQMQIDKVEKTKEYIPYNDKMLHEKIETLFIEDPTGLLWRACNVPLDLPVMILLCRVVYGKTDILEEEYQKYWDAEIRRNGSDNFERFDLKSTIGEIIQKHQLQGSDTLRVVPKSPANNPVRLNEK